MPRRRDAASEEGHRPDDSEKHSEEEVAPPNLQAAVWSLVVEGGSNCDGNPGHADFTI